MKTAPDAALPRMRRLPAQWLFLVRQRRQRYPRGAVEAAQSQNDSSHPRAAGPDAAGYWPLIRVKRLEEVNAGAA